MKKYLSLVFLAVLFSITKAQTITTVAGGNGQGNAANQFDGATAVFLDNSGNIYVSDYSNNRVQKFPANSTSATSGVTVAGGNGSGSAANQINPEGIYVDAAGNLYVADNANNRIQKFPTGSTSSTNATTLCGGNGTGTAANQLNYPGSVFVDGSGNIYVADENNRRIQKFPSGSTSSTNGITVAGGNGSGFAGDQLNLPYSVFLDNSGYLYVADTYDDQIQKFPPNSTSSSYAVTVASHQLNSPYGIFVDSSGYVYVADYGNNRVQKFPPNSDSSTVGITVAGGNGAGSNANQLDGPSGIYVAGNGDIYVADGNNNRIQKWSSGANSIATISTEGNINLYPSPNNGSFILQSSNNIGREYIIHDVIGKTVAQDVIVADRHTVTLKNMSPGIYTLDITGSNDKSIRFVINQ
jgi:sugar lactone lactonase YvrE